MTPFLGDALKIGRYEIPGDVEGEQPMRTSFSKSTRLWSRLAAVICLGLLGVTLTACDKCGNSIFGSNAGTLVCKEKLPQQ
jgi:hypothetical protein